MLQIQHICKKYITGSLVQNALDDVSLNLRDNEFVAILGPSGSGKTTLLNIIGGLDRYDSGDLIINGISTKKYSDRDWDSYRNHTIGFIFQSYNLIPHQTILSNVELALTISGIGKSERKKRAIDALKKVGLGEQMNKRPSQLSGGQMQRVAIARALVNDPDILLADEPTGALDSDTSIQVMDLLKEVAKDRLVVMVTHNPELADEYATRIVRLRDGKIRADSDPFEPQADQLIPPTHQNMGKASMSFLTSLALSFNNLRTKKARTLLTAFAGSIGIIGIALILALSNGVNDYIKTVEEDTLSEYPLQIQSTGFDLTSLMASSVTGVDTESSEEPTDTDSASSENVHVFKTVTSMFSTMNSNDLKALKAYFDSGKSGIETYTNSIEYKYNVVPQIFRSDADSVSQVNPDNSFSSLGIGSSVTSNSMMSSMMSTNIFYEMPSEKSLYEDQYDVKAGRWPESYDECVIVLSSNGNVSDFLLYTLGLRESKELKDMVNSFLNEENVDVPEDFGTYSYEELMQTTFKLVRSSDYYEYDSQYNVWKDKTGDDDYMKNLVSQGEDIKIVGVVQPSEDAKGVGLTMGINYLPSLTEHVIKEAAKSQIVQDQLASKTTNVFTNEPFGEDSDKNSLGSDSLFSIDTSALEKAFQIDDSLLNGNLGSFDSSSFDLGDMFSGDSSSIDLSGLANLDHIDLSLPNMPYLNLGDLLKSIKITATPDSAAALVKELLNGYQNYAKEQNLPGGDYSTLANDFAQYLKIDGPTVIKEFLKKILNTDELTALKAEDLQDLVNTVVTDYQGKYGTDLESFNEYMADPATAKMLSDWAMERFHINIENINISDSDLETLAKDLAEGYQNYVDASGDPSLADPSKAAEYFTNYLNSEEASKLLTEGVSSMLDTTELQSQIATAIQSYMGSAFTSYGTAISSALESQINSAMTQVMTQIANSMGTAMTQMMGGLGTSLGNMMNIDADSFADAFSMNMNGDELIELLTSMSSSQNASYDNNLLTLGYADFDSPSQINIFPKDFESKEEVIKILDHYNEMMTDEGKKEQVITYTDIVGALMSSVTNIINVISYVLIAFVAISLIVSSIMIGVITYISVLERKKEIGILRAIGASKNNISQVFNAETGIIGLCAGLIGIGLSLLTLIPGNAIIHMIAGNNRVNAILPPKAAIILILLSIVLTLIGGLIPSKKAAKSDPVTALRTD